MCTQQLNAVLKHAHDETVTSAWMAEYMARQKTLKPLKTYLKREETKRLLKPGEKMNAAPWLAMMGVENNPNTRHPGQVHSTVIRDRSQDLASYSECDPGAWTGMTCCYLMCIDPFLLRVFFFRFHG
jgi:hypothetical protein